MQKDENLKMLFELHHRQLVEKRQRIHSVTERAIGLFAVAAGWIVATDRTQPPVLQWFIALAVLAIASIACAMLYSTNRSYLQIAAVVQRLNQVFAVYEKGVYLPDQELYPERWKHFGEGSHWRTIWHHLLTVALMAVVCIAVLFWKR